MALIKRGQDGDTAAAIENFRLGAALDIRDVTLRAKLYYHLGNQFAKRNEGEDISLAIQNFQRRTDLELDDLELKSRLLLNLVRALKIRKQPDDLGLAISNLQKLLDLPYEGVEARLKLSWYLDQCVMLRERSKREDLPLLIKNYQAAIALQCNDRSINAKIYNELGGTLRVPRTRSRFLFSD